VPFILTEGVEQGQIRGLSRTRVWERIVPVLRGRQ
jgi:hypothetical protein